jgi:hypothetical protein
VENVEELIKISDLGRPATEPSKALVGRRGSKDCCKVLFRKFHVELPILGGHSMTLQLIENVLLPEPQGMSSLVIFPGSMDNRRYDPRI